MASLGGMGLGVVATARLVKSNAAAKSAGGSSEEKSILDWIRGNFQKEEQFYETDPILKKVEEKNTRSGSGTVSRKSIASSVNSDAEKKPGGFGGFGGLFAKK